MEMNMQKYMAFVKTVELGSFTEAAEKLHYTQAGISRMIADLEREWKLTLLERSKYGVRMTSDGEALLPYAKSLCAEFERMQTQIRDIQGYQTGTIRIGTFSSVATHWLPRIIKEFQKDYPGIDYELLLGDYTEIETWLQEGRVDCGFLRLPTKPELDAVCLARDQLMVVMPEGHLYAGAAAFPLEVLEEEPFMLLEKGAKAEISEILELHGLHPRVQFTTWDDYAVMSMVEQGLGIAILPELILRRVPYRIAAKPLEVPAWREIGFVVKNRATMSLASRRFCEYLKYREAQDGLGGGWL